MINIRTIHTNQGFMLQTDKKKFVEINTDGKRVENYNG